MTNKRRIVLNGPEIILSIGFLVGILFSIFIPYGAGFDEETHILRIYDLSGLNFIPNQGPENKTIGFGEFFTLSYQRKYFQTPAIDFFEPEIFNLQADYDSMAITRTRSNYSPVSFLPQAFMAGVIWRVLDIPIIPGVILLRLTGFIFYSLVVYLSIKIIPVGKWVISILAYLPTSLFQATTLNADLYTNATSFLFISISFFFIINKTVEVRNWKKILLYGVIIFLGFTKPPTILLFGLLFLLPFRSFSKRERFLLTLACVISIIIHLGWFIAPLIITGVEQGGDVRLKDSILLVLQSPFDFIFILINGLIKSISIYYKAWLAVYGYWVGIVPQIIYWLFPPLIFTAIILEHNEITISRKIRIILMIIFFICLIVVSAIDFLPRYFPGDYSVLGSQGRYFIPFTPILFLTLIGIFKFPKFPKLSLIYSAISLFTIITFFYSLGLITTYYSYCGFEKLTNKVCNLPKYKNLEITNSPEVFLNNNNSISQSFSVKCENIEGIDIYIQSLPVEKGSIQFSLLDSNNNSLVRKAFNSDDLKEDSYYKIDFFEKLKTNDTYIIKFESSDLKETNSVGIGMRNDEVYEGDLKINNKFMEGDLIFHYMCSFD